MFSLHFKEQQLKTVIESQKKKKSILPFATTVKNYCLNWHCLQQIRHWTKTSL